MSRIAQCVVLNVNASIVCQGYPISQVVLTAAKFDREINRNGKTKTLKAALRSLQKDFRKAKTEFFKELDRHCTNQEYVDFINKFLNDRRMESETSEERLARRLAV
jgi:pyocin large subunit-like protein